MKVRNSFRQRKSCSIIKVLLWLKINRKTWRRQWTGRMKAIKGEVYVWVSTRIVNLKYFSSASMFQTFFSSSQEKYFVHQEEERKNRFVMLSKSFQFLEPDKYWFYCSIRCIEHIDCYKSVVNNNRLTLMKSDLHARTVVHASAKCREKRKRNFVILITDGLETFSW